MNEAPPSAGFDARAFRELVRLSWRDLSRVGEDLSTGARLNPLKQAAIGLLVLGAFFGLGNARATGSAELEQRLFAALGLLCALLLAPETLKGREAKRELLVPLPITPATAAASRGVSLLLVTGVAALSFSATTLGVLAFRHGLGPASLLLLALALVVEAFAVGVLMHAVALFVGARFGLSRVRQVLQVVLAVALLLTSLGAVFPSVAAPVWSALERAGPWVPLTWFASLARPLEEPLPAAAALGLLLAALAAGSRVDADALYERAASRERGDRAGPGLAERLLAAVAAFPLLGRRLLPPASRAVAETICRSRSRDESMRVQSFVPRLLVVLGAIGAWRAGAPIGAMIVTGLGLFAVLQGLAAAAHSPDWEARWILASAPAPAARQVDGICWSVVVTELPLPCLLLAAVVARERGLLAALALTACFAAGSLLACGARLALRPFAPLAREARLGHGFGTFVFAQLVVLAGVFGIALADTLVGAAGGPGALLLLLPAALAGGGGVLLARHAAGRLEKKGSDPFS